MWWKRPKSIQKFRIRFELKSTLKYIRKLGLQVCTFSHVWGSIRFLTSFHPALKIHQCTSYSNTGRKKGAQHTRLGIPPILEVGGGELYSLVEIYYAVYLHNNYMVPYLMVHQKLSLSTFCITIFTCKLLPPNSDPQHLAQSMLALIKQQDFCWCFDSTSCNFYLLILTLLGSIVPICCVIFSQQNCHAHF